MFACSLPNSELGFRFLLKWIDYFEKKGLFALLTSLSCGLGDNLHAIFGILYPPAVVFILFEQFFEPMKHGISDRSMNWVKKQRNQGFAHLKIIRFRPNFDQIWTLRQTLAKYSSKLEWLSLNFRETFGQIWLKFVKSLAKAYMKSFVQVWRVSPYITLAYITCQKIYYNATSKTKFGKISRPKFR